MQTSWRIGGQCGPRKVIATMVLGVALAATTAACSTREVVRGYIVDEEIVGAIQPGVDNRQSVIGTLGTPTVESTFMGDTWYYVSSRTKQRAFFRERAIAQLILEIQFDDGGTVADIKRYTLADAHNINPRNDTTPTRGKELGFFEQIFGNIGRFSGAPAGPGPGGP